jgi:hypothetical protein
MCLFRKIATYISALTVSLLLWMGNSSRLLWKLQAAGNTLAEMPTTVFENSRFQRRFQQITFLLVHYVIPQHLRKICYRCYHSIWKCPERQLDITIHWTVLLSTGNPQFKTVEAEIPTKASVHLDCFIQDCFKHLALLSVSILIICTWGERVIGFLITKNLAPDVYEVRRIRTEDAGGTARIIITVMRRLTTGIRSEKCVFRRFRRCANVTVYLHKPR